MNDYSVLKQALSIIGVRFKEEKSEQGYCNLVTETVTDRGQGEEILKVTFCFNFAGEYRGTKIE